jgi:hypothetical protein
MDKETNAEPGSNRTGLDVKDSPLWVIQNNLGSHTDIQSLEAACNRLGYPSLSVKVTPFSDEVPDVPSDRPVLFYGSARFIQNVQRLGRWIPGAFWEERLFRFSTLLQNYGSHMLNASAQISTMAEFAAQTMNETREFFIRPDRDLKEFAGGIFTFAEFRDWADRLRPGGFEIDLSMPIVAADPLVIDEEWRLFVADQRVVTGSLYRQSGELCVSRALPDNVMQFGNLIARLWSPAPLFALDVARVKEGLRVIEANGFNSSGFYASDVERIVTEASRLASI